MSQNLEHIVTLQKALDRLSAAQRQLAGIPDWMADLHAEHSEQKELIDEVEREIEEAASLRRHAEAQVADLHEKLKHYQDQISRVQTQREYGALLQEIDTTKDQIKTLEEEALAQMECQDEGQKRVDEQRAEFTDLDQRYSAELEKWEAEKPSVESEAKELESLVEQTKQQLPSPLLTQFERIYERYDGKALAHISKVEAGGRGPQEWHCGACNYRVRPQVVVEIRTNGRPANCDSCKRFLYFDEESA